jgi:phosphatidylglycerol:prolipoprotein diacylglycerol transferase
LHFPVTINIGSWHILLHNITEPLCMLIGFRYYLYLRKKQGDIISTDNRLWIFIGAIAGAILGSRLTGGFENPPELFASENIWLYFYSNKTVLGGFLGGLFGVEIIKKIVGEKNSSGDLFTYPMILALIIGRIGCFSIGLAEETYGIPTRLFTGINLGDGLYRHPVCIYEMAFLALLWMMLVKLESKVILKPGSRFKIFMIAYILFRFLLDFIKPHYTFNFGLSTIQLACLIGLLYYLRDIVQPKKLILQHA